MFDLRSGVNQVFNNNLEHYSQNNSLICDSLYVGFVMKKEEVYILHSNMWFSLGMFLHGQRGYKFFIIYFYMYAKYMYGCMLHT